MEQVSMVLEPVRAFLIQLGEFLPKLIIAVIILLAGWLLAKAIKLAVVKGLRSINFNVVTERAGIDNFLQQGGAKTDTIDILGVLVYWLVILAALMIAFNSLGLALVTELIGRIAMFVPKVMVAVLVLVFGAYFSRFIDNAISTYGKNVGLEDAELLGRLARYAIMVFVVLIALEQVQVATELVRLSFLILLAGVVLALALAFGIGSQNRAAEMLERWWPKQTKKTISDKE
ncbi:MAG: mechanosensitive ion channel family protein [Sulfuriferula sp.]